MVKNLWNIVKITCANHNNTPEMKLSNTGKRLLYICECEGCNNKITIDDYENALKKISSEIEIAEQQDEIVNLKNYKWVQKNVSHKIICYKENKIVLATLNKKNI